MGAPEYDLLLWGYLGSGGLKYGIPETIYPERICFPGSEPKIDPYNKLLLQDTKCH